MREDGDIGEIWDEAPRFRPCHRCDEYARQLLALQTELRWQIEALNTATGEAKRLAVLLELAKYDAPTVR